LFTVSYYSDSEKQKRHTILTIAVQMVRWWKPTTHVSSYLCWVGRSP